MTDAPARGDGTDQRPLRTALFVDFDNVYLTLHAADARSAEAFATEPAAWVRWLEAGMPDMAGPGPARRVLMRRCYLNPSSFRRYRGDFTRAGFRVADCPSLTRAGKSSTDIHMVVDILDALEHATPFDEFIFFSSDADFTPVLQRLREHDRRTAILAVGPAAAAYKASTDVVIAESAFVEHALGLPPGAVIAAHEPPSREATGPAEIALMQRIAQALREECIHHGPLPATELPAIYKRFQEFARSNWLGFYSLRALTDAVVALEPAIEVVDGDPWRLEWRPLGVDVVQMAPRRAEDQASQRFLRRACELTGAPALAAAEHAAAFEALAAALSSGPEGDAVAVAHAAESVLSGETSVMRGALQLILQTLASAGHPIPAMAGTSAAALADRYKDAIAAALENAGAPADEAEIEILDRWVCQPVRQVTSRC